MPLTLKAQSDFNIEPIVETGQTFEENAIMKARHASRHSGLPAIADDSGLTVDYLDGAPGIYSARFAGDNATDQDNIAKLLQQLESAGRDERKACFQCVIAMVMGHEDASPIICHGRLSGNITTGPRGDNGFGYDPVFFLRDFNKTCSELDPDVKNRVSHRAKALAELKRGLN